MPRGRPPTSPTRLQFEICHQLLCEGRSQREVARRFGLSQPRVAQILNKVQCWIDQVMPRDLLRKFKAPQRLQVAIVARHSHLEQAYGRYFECFGGRDAVVRYARLLAGLEAEFDDALAALPPRESLIKAFQMVHELREFEDLIQRGSRGPAFTKAERQFTARQGQPVAAGPASAAL